MYNDYMYAIERSDDYLAHYGIKGMKWGVRKAIERGGSGYGNRRLGKQYKKAAKKLAKLEKRAANGKKYAKRAAALGAGAAAAGGLAALGTSGVSSLMVRGGRHVPGIARRTGSAMDKVGTAMVKYGRTGATRQLGMKLATGGKAMNRNASGLATKIGTAAGGLDTWGKANAGQGIIDAVKSSGIRKGIRPGHQKFIGDKLHEGGKALRGTGLTNNTIARAGAATIGAGLAGAAGYNAYRAATTKRAAKKAAQFRSEMNKAFKGTAYANGAPKKKRRR